MSKQTWVDLAYLVAAIAAPAAPMRLPLRADFGDESPLSARMKQIAATR